MIIRIRTVQAFLSSLLLHLLILLLFVLSFEDLKMPEPQPQSQKISLNLKEFVPPAPAPKPQPVSKPLPPTPPEVPQPVQKPVEKPVKKTEPVKTEKKVIEKSPLIVQKSVEANTTKIMKTEPKKLEKPKKVVKKEKAKEVKKQPPKRVARPKPPSRPKRSRDPLANALMGAGTSVSPKPSAQRFAERMVKQHYGKEFYTYSPEQQKFIKRKLGEIFRITQNTLWRKGYPNDAIRMHMQGTNVVQFYLHPNGDISGLRLRSEIGYRSLDSNTLEVIRTAYKDYPRPKKKTKIIFHVTYKLY